MADRLQEQRKLEQIGKRLQKAADQERRHRRKKRVIAKVLAWMFTGAAALALIAVIAVGALLISGRNNLRKQNLGAAPVLSMTAQEEREAPDTSYEWEEGWVRYEDKIYEYNDHIMTFLIMGIDKKTPVREAEDATDGGQSDALFLVVVNPDTEDIKIIAVNRDTMVDIYMYGLEENNVTPVIKGQITLQHGFGDGLEQSCEAEVKAVSDLFYGLPINGYAAINMGAISEMTDLVGGVDLTVMEDLTQIHSDWTRGASVSLTGKDAYDYVHYRDITVFESARGRLERQKQFLSILIGKAKEGAKKDITLPVRMYQQLARYMVTDISVDEAAYLAAQVLDYRFDGGEIYTMEGTTIMGERFEEFYPDYEALKDLMIQVFYREVDPDGAEKE